MIMPLFRHHKALGAGYSITRIHIPAKNRSGKPRTSLTTAPQNPSRLLARRLKIACRQSAGIALDECLHVVDVEARKEPVLDADLPPASSISTTPSLMALARFSGDASSAKILGVVADRRPGRHRLEPWRLVADNDGAATHHAETHHAHALCIDRTFLCQKCVGGLDALLHVADLVLAAAKAVEHEYGRHAAARGTASRPKMPGKARGGRGLRCYTYEVAMGRFDCCRVPLII